MDSSRRALQTNGKLLSNIEFRVSVCTTIFKRIAGLRFYLKCLSEL